MAATSVAGARRFRSGRSLWAARSSRGDRRNRRGKILVAALAISLLSIVLP
jgi:hypothetical protein